MSSKILWLLIVVGILGQNYIFASEEHSKSQLLELDPGLAFWTVVTFVTLLLVLKKFAWKPLLESIDAREKHIRDNITNAEQTRENAEKLLEEGRQKITSAHQEAKGIVESATHQAVTVRQQQVLQTEKECTNVKIHAKKQIQNLQTKAIEDMLNNIGNLSIEIAGKITQKSLSDQDHKQIINDSIVSMRKEFK